MTESQINLRVTLETKAKRQLSIIVECEGGQSCEYLDEADLDTADETEVVEECDAAERDYIFHFEEHMRRLLINHFAGRGMRVVKIEKISA